MCSPDFTWLIEQGADIFKKYAGKWIAVHDGKIIGVGDTATEAAERARAESPGSKFILEAVDPEGDVVYAGI
jgi:hypothetical protein